MKRNLLSERDLSRKPLQRLLPAVASSRSVYTPGAMESKPAPHSKKPEYEMGEVYRSLKHIKPSRGGRRALTGMPTQSSFIARYLKKTHSADSNTLRIKQRSDEDNLIELMDNINRNTKNFYDVENYIKNKDFLKRNENLLFFEKNTIENLIKDNFETREYIRKNLGSAQMRIKKLK